MSGAEEIPRATCPVEVERVQASTDDRLESKVDQMANVMNDLTEMMGKFVSSVISKQQHEPQVQQQQRLYNPYPKGSRYAQQFARQHPNPATKNGQSRQY